MASGTNDDDFGFVPDEPDDFGFVPDAPGTGDVAVPKAQAAAPSSQFGVGETALMHGARGIAGDLPAKAAAAISASIYDRPEGTSWGDSYDYFMRASKERERASAEQRPLVAGTSDAIGTALPYLAAGGFLASGARGAGLANTARGAALARTLKVSQPVAQAAGRVGEMALKGAALSGAQSLAKGADAQGALTSAAMGAAFPVAQVARAIPALEAARAVPAVGNVIAATPPAVGKAIAATPALAGIGMGATAALDPNATAADRVSAAAGALQGVLTPIATRYGSVSSRTAEKVAPVRKGAEEDALALARELQTRQAKFDHATQKREANRQEQLSSVRHQKDMLDRQQAYGESLADYEQSVQKARDTADAIKSGADKLAAVESEAGKLKSQRDAEMARLEKAARGEGLTPEEARLKAINTLRAQYGEAHTRTDKMLKDAERGITRPTAEQLAEIEGTHRHTAESLLRNTPESVDSVAKAKDMGFGARAEQIAQDLMRKANAGDPEAAAALEQMRNQTPDFRADAEASVTRAEVQRRADRVRRTRAAAKEQGIDLSGVSDEDIIAGRIVSTPEKPEAPDDDGYKRAMLDLRERKLSATPFDAKAEGIARTTPAVVERAIQTGGSGVRRDMRDAGLDRDLTEQYLRESEPSRLRRVTNAILGATPGGVIGGPTGAAAGAAVGAALSNPRETFLRSNFFGKSSTRWGLEPGDPSVRRFSNPNEAAAILRAVEAELGKRGISSQRAAELNQIAAQAAAQVALQRPEVQEWLRKKLEARQ